MSDIFVGDVGTEISLDCGIDVANATVKKIIVKKPDGKRVQWVAQLDGTNAIKYTTALGDIDVAGDWDMQAYIELPTWRGKGSVATMKVKDPI